MAMVYIVTRGEYSDYGIVGIFSKERLAKRYVNAIPEGEREHYQIEPYPLDALVGDKPVYYTADGIRAWLCGMYKKLPTGEYCYGWTPEGCLKAYRKRYGGAE